MTAVGQPLPSQDFCDTAALPLETGHRSARLDGRKVPEGDYSHRSKQPHYSTTASARAINVR
jgi:hypothetical protein